MDKILETIKIEKETVSDTEYIITEIYVENGEKIEKGTLLFSFETSKADVDVEATKSGYLYHNLIKGKKVEVGDEVGFVLEDELDRNEQLFEKSNNLKRNNNIDWGDVRVSKKAKKLIDVHSLSEKDFKGLKMIREKDVLDVIEKSEENISEVEVEGTNFNYNDIIIIGGKGGAKMVIEAIRSSSHYGIKGIVDPELEKGEKVLGLSVLGGDNELQNLKKEGYKNIVLSFSSLMKLKSREEKYWELKKMGFQFPNIIHNRATVEPSVVLGEGNIILANSMIGSEVHLGNINYVNTGSMICHESKVLDNNHFAPNSVIAGRISIGKNNLIGMCVTTFFDIKIGDANIINNGFNLVKDIKDNQVFKND